MTTPSKINFTSKELATPNKDCPGILKTGYMHISNLHRILTNWVNINSKGIKVCKAIAALKLYEYDLQYYPQQLQQLTESLLDARRALQIIVEEAEVINKQLQALAKLQPTEEPVIFTWSTTQISISVAKIYDSLLKEYKLKDVIVENIAHCRDEKLTEIYVSAWEFEVYIDFDSVAYLFAEVGLPVLI